jgi:branched-chain amino acid aminotransferase
VTRSSVLEIARDRGLTVEERKFTLQEWKDSVADGSLAEVFACGTAAVITPIGELKTSSGSLVTPSTEGEPQWNAIREELLGIQAGTVEDRRGWLTRLA